MCYLYILHFDYYHLLIKISLCSFCGLCLDCTFNGDRKSIECHNHVKTCIYNEHFKGDYYTRDFYSQYQQYRRFAQKWNDFVVGGEVSFDVIITLMSKLVPIVQDSNLVFNDAGYVDVAFTEQQLGMINDQEPPRRGRRRAPAEPRRYLCGICRQEGHNRMRCPLRRQQNNEVEEVVENIFAQPPAHEVIQIE